VSYRSRVHLDINSNFVGRPFKSKIKDLNLAEMLSSGVAYYHENMSKGDQEIVKQLFEVGAVQVSV
jgi:pre-mRNA-splicing helicase BRR2